jgi:hypothetical protein
MGKKVRGLFRVICEKETRFLVYYSLFIFQQSNATRSEDLNNLKQELEIDDHKIPIAEHYRRLNVNPETVSIKKSLTPV